MGNEASNEIGINKELHYYKYENQFGEIMISLDKKIYKPGDTVSGTIYLKLDTEFPSNEVKLAIQGYEEILYFHPLKHGLVKQCYEKNVKYDNIYTINKFDKNHIQYGDYVFPFKIKLKQDLLPSFNKEYIDDNNPAYSRIKYEMIAFLSRGYKPETTLLSNEIEIFVDSKEHLNDQIINSVSLTKCFSKLVLVKGELRNLTNENFIFGGKEYNFEIKLDGLKNNTDFDEVNLELISYHDVRTTKEAKDYKRDIIFKKSLGQLRKKSNANYPLKIEKHYFNLDQPSYDSHHIKQHYYVIVYLINKLKKIHLKLQFPILVKNGIPQEIFYDAKYFYYSGNKQTFEDGFEPKINQEVDCTNLRFEKNTFLLTDLQEKEFINNVVKLNGQIILNHQLEEQEKRNNQNMNNQNNMHYNSSNMNNNNSNYNSNNMNNNNSNYNNNNMNNNNYNSNNMNNNNNYNSNNNNNMNNSNHNSNNMNNNMNNNNHNNNNMNNNMNINNQNNNMNNNNQNNNMNMNNQNNNMNSNNQNNNMNSNNQNKYNGGF